MAVLLKGVEVVISIKERLSNDIEELYNKGITPKLAIIRIGSKPSDISYERSAVKRCAEFGVACKVIELKDTISQGEFKDVLIGINQDVSVHGILIFRPLPEHYNESEIKAIINPLKDVDCICPVNIAKLFENDESGFLPCTPEAVIEILNHYSLNLKEKNVVVIGRSQVVGKPLSLLLLKQNATVTVCHSNTKNLEQICKQSDIIISAIGKAKMINDAFVSKGQAIIDVGINVDRKGNLCGDIDFEKIENLAAYITPVPGGVGVVTTAVLAKHVINAAKRLNL